MTVKKIKKITSESSNLYSNRYQKLWAAFYIKNKQTHFELLKMIHHQGFRSGTFPILSPCLPICFYKDSSSYGATFPSFMKHSALSFSIPSIKSVHHYGGLDQLCISCVTDF